MLEKKIKEFDEATRHFRPVFNYREEDRHIILQAGAGQDIRNITITPAEFELLGHLVTHPMSKNEYAILLNKQPSTIKTQLSSLYRKFNLDADFKNNQLIATLLESGALMYIPASTPQDIS